MKFIITGSGGCVCTPKPLCQCRVCVEARERGRPYARCGCSLYLEEAALLVDTPEDIALALNSAGIRAVEHIVYSHWHPDHTLGLRVLEQLRLEWIDFYEGVRPRWPVVVYAQQDVMDGISAIGGKFGSFLDYYEEMGLARRQMAAGSLRFGSITVTPVAVPGGAAVSVFVFEQNGKKLVYAPCDCKPFPEERRTKGADVLVLGSNYVGNSFKNGRAMAADNPLRQELFSLEEALALRDRLGARELVLTHIEELWGKSYGDYCMLEGERPGLRFAFDGMEIAL